jgi:hypothetical protein
MNTFYGLSEAFSEKADGAIFKYSEHFRPSAPAPSPLCHPLVIFFSGSSNHLLRPRMHRLCLRGRVCCSVTNVMQAQREEFPLRR